MKWTYLSSCDVAPSIFGVAPNVVKVAKFKGEGDVRMFRLRGWNSFADLLDCDPRTGKQLQASHWFVFVVR